MLNLAALKKIVLVGLQAGVLAGLLLTGVQRIQVSPLIQQAEQYEQAANAAAAQAVHEHEHEQHEHAGHEPEHEHEHGGWQPESGAERNLYTALANVNLAVGFALLLGAAMFLRGGATGWRAGLMWGLAGYAVFFVAPSLGLPPEVPGAEAAPLAGRQVWWLIAVMATAAGLALLVFGRQRSIRLLGAFLLAVPHLIGAPQPAFPGGAAPAELARAFIFASAAANAVFWLALGALSGWFYQMKKNP